MAGYNSYTLGMSTGNEIANTITSNLTTMGWTNVSGFTWTNVTGGRTMTVDMTGMYGLTGTGAAYMTVNNRIAYFPVVSTWVSAQITLLVSVANDFFFVQIRGPVGGGAAGSVDTTNGSPWAYAMITTIDPASPTDTNADDLQVCIYSHPNTSTSQQWATAFQKKNTAGTADASCEFLVDKPAVQDIAAVGDLPPSILAGSGFFGSRYKVVDTTLGFRGQLNNVAFASEAYTLTGDSASQQYTPNAEFVRKGIKYVVIPAAGYTNMSSIIQSHPLGTSHANPAQVNTGGQVVGPRIFIKKGDGA